MLYLPQSWPHRHVSKSPIIIAPNLPSKALEDGFLDAFPATSAHKIKQHPQAPDLGHTAEIYGISGCLISLAVPATCSFMLTALTSALLVRLETQKAQSNF